MPIKKLASVDKREIKELLQVPGLNRSQIAEKLSLTMDGVNAWTKKGRIPQDQYEKLLELRKDQLINLFEAEQCY